MRPITLLISLLLVVAQNAYPQSNPYPNELKGYRFFGTGKLKVLKLGASTKDDVIKVFGKNCEDNCDYDKNWAIQFSYIDKENCMTVYDGRKQTLCPADKFIGKLYSIDLKPKKRISFAMVSFTNFGGRGGGGTSSHDGEGGGMNISFDSFSDGYGMSYQIFDKATFSEKEYSLMKKGDLYSIEYQMPDKLRDSIYTVEK